jgi:hypothetical protein
MIAVCDEKGSLPQDHPLESPVERLPAQGDCDDLVEKTKQTSKKSALFDDGVGNGGERAELNRGECQPVFCGLQRDDLDRISNGPQVVERGAAHRPARWDNYLLLELLKPFADEHADGSDTSHADRIDPIALSSRVEGVVDQVAQRIHNTDSLASVVRGAVCPLPLICAQAGCAKIPARIVEWSALQPGLKWWNGDGRRRVDEIDRFEKILGPDESDFRFSDAQWDPPRE